MSDIDVISRLDTVIRLLCLVATQNKRQLEKVEILSSAGLQPKAIADLIGTTPNTVRVALSNMRRKGAKKPYVGQEKEG